MMTGVNDPVAFALLSKGVPNTPENYNRMKEALRVGGWTGGNAPVTAETQRRGRGYMPQRGEESASIDEGGEGTVAPPIPVEVNDLEPVDMDYLDSMNSQRQAPAPAAKQAVAKQAAGGDVVADAAPAAQPGMDPQALFDQQMSMPPVDAIDGQLDPMAVGGGIAATLAALYGANKYMSRPPVNPMPIAAAAADNNQKRLALPAPGPDNRPPVEKSSGAGEKYAQQQKTKAKADNDKAASDKAAEDEYNKRKPYIEGNAKREANQQAKKPAGEKTKLREKAVEATRASKAARRAIKRVK